MNWLELETKFRFDFNCLSASVPLLCFHLFILTVLSLKNKFLIQHGTFYVYFQSKFGFLDYEFNIQCFHVFCFISVSAWRSPASGRSASATPSTWWARWDVETMPNNDDNDLHFSSSIDNNVERFKITKSNDFKQGFALFSRSLKIASNDFKYRRQWVAPSVENVVSNYPKNVDSNVERFTLTATMTCSFQPMTTSRQTL